jgi:hypothetical protein
MKKPNPFAAKAAKMPAGKAKAPAFGKKDKKDAYPAMKFGKK